MGIHLRKFVLLIIVATFIHGCSKPPTHEVQEPPIHEEQELPRYEEPDPAPKPTEDVSQDVPNEPEQPNEPIEHKYAMNKVYRFVPLDESIDKKAVLLTFDDGPKEMEMIEALLETLDKHQAKAIFFVNGYRIKSKPDLLKLIYERGQVIGNHSWDHIDLRKESSDKMAKQVKSVQDIVDELTGEAPMFFRPPHGAGNDELKELVKSEGMLYMTWSNGSLDWDKSTKNKPQAVIDNVMKQLHPGSNILMHELPWTVEALDEMLTKIEDEGYSFIDPKTIKIDAE